VRLIEITLQSEKRVEADLVFSPVMVLFGPNDSGKSNIIEAFEDVVAGSDLFQRPTVEKGWSYSEEGGFSKRGKFMFGAWSESSVLLELDGLDIPGHPDQRQLRDVATNIYVEDAISEEDDECSGVWLINVDPSTDSEAREVAASFIIERASDACDDWDSVRDAFVVVLDACLKSREFLLNGQGELSWLAPDASGWSGEIAASCAHLAAQRSLWLTDRVPFLDRLVERTKLVSTAERAFIAFLVGESELFKTVPFIPAVVIPAAMTLNPQNLVARIEDFITESEFETIVEVQGQPARFAGTLGAERWLAREGDLVGIDERVVALCGELAAAATEIAPPFVNANYDILVQPLLPSDWPAYGGRKVRIALQQRSTGETFHIALVGSGLQTWAYYSLIEAMRTWPGEHTPPDPGDATSTEHPPLVQAMEFYVFDEPERHLHPSAQRQVARWIADRVKDGANALIATHSVEFLDLPYAGAEYFRVYRDPKETTHTVRLTHDPLGTLDRFVEDAGLTSRAQLIQLTRAVLVVEGEHERIILERLASRELRAARIRVLPLRGAKNASAIADLEYLRALNVPIAVMFDNVTRALFAGSKQTPRDSLEESEILRMLRDWPKNRKPPVTIAFPFPDIVCALPGKAVDTQMRRKKLGEFVGWDTIVRQYKALPVRERHDFKNFVGQRTGLSIDSATIRAVLAHTPGGLTPETPLYKPLQYVLALTE
jgi:energy-coupling factor transporter ATP-binding protein EcfA2